MDNNVKITQKELKRIEVQKRKFQLEQERVIKPPECYKFLTAIIHKDILCEASGSNIESKLQSMTFNVEKSRVTTPGTITWKRKFNQKIIGDDGNVINFDDIEEDEPYLLMIIDIKEFLQAIKEKRLMEKVQAAQEMCTKNPTSTTLIIYGLKAHCRKNKKATNAQETEMHLTQLQLLANCSHRLFETPDEVALTVSQISKAIAEEPYKIKLKQKSDQEKLFLSNDIKVSAKEDDPASLARLWQTQLICLPLVTFEVAQPITKQYPMPRDLIEAYKNCTGNKEQMLADLQIIKTGPLNKNPRRIGPELSRKICNLMTSKNPNDLL